MDLLVRTKTRRARGPTVPIHCPLCHASAVAADSYELSEEVVVQFVFPVFRWRNTFVTCPACKRELVAKLPLAELANHSPSQLSPHLVGRESLVGNFLAIACAVLCWVPAVGLVLGVVAALVNRRATGWPRTASRIGLAVAVVVTLGLTVLGIIECLQ